MDFFFCCWHDWLFSVYEGKILANRSLLREPISLCIIDPLLKIRATRSYDNQLHCVSFLIFLNISVVETGKLSLPDSTVNWDSHVKEIPTYAYGDGQSKNLEHEKGKV